jgi:hypothetical protein
VIPIAPNKIVMDTGKLGGLEGEVTNKEKNVRT